MYLFLALIAAIAFASGSMVFKRAFAEGATTAHLAVVNNVILAALFLPLLALERKPIPWSDWEQPALTGVFFAVGHLLSVLALRVGDVSVATPLLGSKIIFVALIGWVVFRVPLNTVQWIASALATLGVIIMGITDAHGGRRVGLTTAAALGCAAFFALTDTCIQAWGGAFGVWSFLALQFLALAVASALMLPFLGKGTLRASRTAWKWILLGAFFSGVQAILITAAIAIWKDAVGVNVVYATRGLWSIVLVWCVGHWVKNTERHTAGGRAMGMRLAGALLIFVAVLLSVLWTRGSN
jgi:drug/metabolite transporter (DMT)-like permease